MNTFTSIETKVSKEMRIPEFSWRGIFDFILIIFGNDERTVVKREESTNIKSFAENFEKNELQKRINEIEKHLNALKNSTIKTLDNLKRTVNQRLKEIEVEIVNTKSKFENIKKDIEKNKTYHQSEQIKLNFTQQIIDEMNELVRFEYE
jgi:phenylalanyl-tRNA synthetase alpha subunit